MLDQWGAPWVFSDADDDSANGSDPPRQRISADRHELTVTASINANNPQGAVLWGVRTNRTIRGVLHLSTLVVSLPGTVELKFTTKTTTTSTSTATSGGSAAGSSHRDKAKDTSTTITTVTTALGLLYMSVVADPLAPGYGQGSAAACVFVFKEAVCPVYSHAMAVTTGSSSSGSSGDYDTSSLSSSLVTAAEEADWLADFPMVRGFLPAISATVAATSADTGAAATATTYHDHYRLYLSLSCANTFTNSWAVDTEVNHTRHINANWRK